MQCELRGVPMWKKGQLITRQICLGDYHSPGSDTALCTQKLASTMSQLIGMIRHTDANSD